MKGYLLLSIVFFNFQFVKANNTKNKYWQIIVSANKQSFKGKLLNVTDSSVIILQKGYSREILFDSISKIKFRRIETDNTGKRIGGFFIGGIGGGTIIGMVMSGKRQGEPAALAGVIGGIGGGLLSGIAGALLTPVIWHIFTNKRIAVEHSAGYYPLLKDKLIKFSLQK